MPYQWFSFTIIPSYFCTTLLPIIQISPQLQLIPFVMGFMNIGCDIVAPKDPWIVRIFGIELNNGF